MQQATPTPTTADRPPFFSNLFGGGGSTASNTRRDSTSQRNGPPSPTGKAQQRPPSSGEDIVGGSPRQRLQKDRKPSFGRKPSFVFTSPAKRNRRRADSAASNSGAPPTDVFDPSLGPSSLPDPSPHTTTDGFSKMLSRGAVTPVSGYPVGMAGSASMMSQQSELATVHQHIQETISKRISTLDYLRKAHEGRIYWFNTLLFDKPDLQRSPYFDARKLGRRAANYMLLGISLPAVIDLNSSTPVDFLRSLNTLLAEFDAFSQIHTENGLAATSLTRTRIPQMFRRAAAPVSKGRRSSSSAAAAGRAAAAALPDSGDIGYALEQVDSNTAAGSATAALPNGGGLPSTTTNALTPVTTNGGGGPSIPTTTSTTTDTPHTLLPTPAGPSTTTSVSVITFPATDLMDLLPGEEYTHLLTPSLPFEPDYFETYATLCDALTDAYARLAALLPTPRECAGSVGELFTKADGRIRKLFVQGVVREFEEMARVGGRGEVASVGRVVLGGLM